MTTSNPAHLSVLSTGQQLYVIHAIKALVGTVPRGISLGLLRAFPSASPHVGAETVLRETILCDQDSEPIGFAESWH